MSQLGQLFAVAASGVTSLTGDVGLALTGALKIKGGNNISTAALGADITVNVSGTTNHAIQLGNAGGSLSSLGVGATGTVLTGVTGADPAFSATPSVTSITATNFYTSPLTTGSTLSGATWAGDGTDPNIDMTITPQGTGDLVLTTGDVSLTSGNLLLPTTSSTVGQIQINSTRWAHAFGTSNIFIGENAGNFTLAGATANIGIGSGTQQGLTSGDANINIGTNSGGGITSGGNNVCVGSGTMQLYTTAQGNSAFGFQAMLGTGGGTSAIYNVAVGYEALKVTNGSSYNTVAGTYAADAVSTGSYNVALGANCLTDLTTGDNNVAIGTITNLTGGGSALTGADHSNIMIMNVGVAGDVHTTRIGTQGNGAGQQNKAYMAGVYGVTVAAATTALATVDTNGQLGSLALALDGQIPIGSTGAAPVLATITAGANITVTNGAGTITIASSSFAWNQVAGNTVSPAVINNGYITQNAGLTTITLPAAAVYGSTIEIIGEGAGGFVIAQNAGQNIQYGNLSTTPGVGGSLASSNRYDTVRLVCRVANTTFHVTSATGVLNVV